jgi:hypothetical protein
MKRILLSLMFVASISLVFAQNQQVKDLNLNLSKEVQKTVKMQKDLRGTGIDNADFETWSSSYAGAPYQLGDMPEGWFMITGNQGDQQNADAQNGDYAMHVESNVTTNGLWTDTLVGGLSLIGDLVAGAQGEPYTDRLESMSFYIKGELESNDTALVVMQLFKEGDFVGGAGQFFGAADLTTSYQEITAPFEYESTQVPDSAMIIVSSTGVGVFQDDIGTLTADSYIDVDNFTFEVEDISDPLADLTPTSWDAGDVEISTSTTSGVFTLTNAGVGTLTVSSATDLSGTPYTTTFDAGDVSLDEAEDYTFTFDYNPLAYGTYNETFTIETNGGTVEVALSGACNEPITGDMDGGFEDNVNDFDLTFTGWTQHDEDGSGTYGFEGIDFTNTGYTGSYIAFNPANTDPAMTADAIQPNTGDRFGACFAATSPPNDDWLITPQSSEINAGASLNFWAKSYTDAYGLEKYKVWVSTSGTAIADFTDELTSGATDADTLWTEISYDLSSYAGDQIYIAIQCVSNDAFIFMVDDILLDAGVNVSDAEIKEISIYPNPANDIVTVANAENAEITIVNMLGQRVISQTANSDRETINVSDLTDGTYIIRVESNDKVTTQKLNVVK